MITYRIMDAMCPMPTCLHKGPLPLAQSGELAYLETISDISPGTVAHTLQAIATRYGTCGVLAIEDGMVVGKIRAYPQTIIDRVPNPCVQQEQTFRPLMTLDYDNLPTQADLPVLHLFCMQVAATYAGRRIAGGLLDTLINWARTHGWQELRARAVSDIPPLLAWSGQMSRVALERRGFTVTGSSISPELREGVVSQRAGDHGDTVRAQWDAFAQLSDDEAGSIFAMRLNL